MPSSSLLTIRISLRPDSMLEFADWQARLNAQIVSFPGFVSLEISSPESDKLTWVIVQRFYNAENVANWRVSKEYKELIEELKELLLKNHSRAFQEIELSSAHLENGVTEVFLTQVSSDKEEAYRKWMAKIHQIEAQFPGFKGVYVQSPSQGQGRNWITLLQFDTAAHLDCWLASVERQEALVELKPLIASLENQRVISPYAGWFASLATGEEAPSVWKQTMLVLLVLFPIVMLELKYLSPLTNSFNPSLATFIGNAISVTLISWPFMPIALYFLGWWLKPENNRLSYGNLKGLGLLILLYLIEVALFWKLL